jgi:SAM-dependent methyltransferase
VTVTTVQATPAGNRLEAPSVERLHEAVAALCHGATAVASFNKSWPAALEASLGQRVAQVDLNAPGTRRFRTVVVADAIEHLAHTARRRLLDIAIEQTELGGRLVVVVRNGDSDSREEPDRLRQRDLRTLLYPYGRPTVVTNQPFAWLVMYLRRRGARTRPPSRARQHRHEVTARLCRGRVLELGCGDGALAGAIDDVCREVIGVDVSAARIRKARDTYPNVTFIERDILDLGLPEATFDTVVLAGVLEHASEEVGAAMLDVAWRHVRRSGRLIVGVPNGSAMARPSHVRRFHRRDLERLLAPFGAPRLSTAQPFKWLLMHVDRPR